MNKVRLALILITVAITIGPILGMVLAYQNNLPGLIIPDKVEQIMSGIENINPEGIIQQNQTGTPDVQFNLQEKTFAVTVRFTNTFTFDITSISGPMQCDEHRFALGEVALKNPSTLKAGVTTMATFQGTFTDAAVTHIETAHQGEKSMKVSLASATIKTDGMTIKISEPISLGEIPLT